MAQFQAILRPFSKKSKIYLVVSKKYCIFAAELCKYSLQNYYN